MAKQAKPKARSAAKKRQTATEKRRKRKQELKAILFFVFGLLFLALAVVEGENIWLSAHNIYLGLFGIVAYIMPIILILVGILMSATPNYDYSNYGFWQFPLLALLISGAVQIFSYVPLGEAGFIYAITAMYQDGIAKIGSGVSGSLFGWSLLGLFGKTGAIIIISILLLLFILLVSGSTLLELFSAITSPVTDLTDAYQERSLTRGDRRPISIESGAPVILPAHPVESKTNINDFIPKFPEEIKEIKEEEELAEEKNSFRVPDVNNMRNELKAAKTAPIEKSEELARYMFDLEKEPIVKEKNFSVYAYKPDLSGEDAEEILQSQSLQEEQVPEDTPADISAKTAEITLDISNLRRDFLGPDFGEEMAGKIVISANEDIKPATVPSAEESEIAKTSEPEKKQETAAIKEVSPPIIEELPPEEEDRYNFPSLDLLDKPRPHRGKMSEAELKANADKLVETLRSFGVKTSLLDVSQGPTVTRYELKPDLGVKISKITSLADDIALNMASAGVRIEAPIPNKPAVGIEVPNKNVGMVNIIEILSSKTFTEAKSKLTVALGKGISGKEIVTDLSKMPHLLIAGSTGSGKSVCINSLIISLLYKSTPDEVRFLMIDPKVVELGVYNDIPHLLVPVVTDPRKAAGALGWAVSEMLKRYQLFADNGVKDIKGYNALAGENEEIKTLPQIVIIIDELADLMIAAAGEVEDAIFRLAQMARAAGMHLVIATQRPSVDVITGVIKANIPSRIAFAVSSGVDSRTILDAGGAEKLLGRGDMLFSPAGGLKASRIQGCYVDDKEVARVVNFIKKGEEVEYDNEVIEEIDRQTVQDAARTSVSFVDEDEDEMLEEAIVCVLEANTASTSYLQRKLRIGYARAARMMDMMEERGIIGPPDGSRPREILTSLSVWREQNVE